MRKLSARNAMVYGASILPAVELTHILFESTEANFEQEVFFSFCVLQSFEPRIERKVEKGGKIKTEQGTKGAFSPFSRNVLRKELYRLLFLPFSHFGFLF